MKIAFADRDLLIQALSDLGYMAEEGEDLRITDGVRSVKVDFLVSIPLRGKLESLNASAAATVLMYEVVRQRSGKAAL